jgi:hypothetical protein
MPRDQKIIAVRMVDITLLADKKLLLPEWR